MESGFPRFADRLLGIGFAWLLFGLAIAPTQKLYFQVLVPFLYIPALCLIVMNGRSLCQRLRDDAQLSLFLLLWLWAGISMSWSVGIDLEREAKRLLFVVLFVVGGTLWSMKDNERLMRTLMAAGGAIAVCALLAMVLWPWRTPEFTDRMTGFCALNHPIFAGYVMGAAAVWLASWIPAGRLWRGLWLAALATLVVFVVLTWSRGAIMALALCLVLAPLWSRHAHVRWIAIATLACGGVVAIVFSSHLLERGVSYRPEIFRGALEKIAQHPWLGIGKGTDYQLVVGSNIWPHSHNLFTHSAIELGVVAMVALLVLWVLIFLRGLRYRHTPLGRALVGLWLFATVALQFDGAQLWDAPGPFWLLTWLPLVMSLSLGGSGAAASAAPGDSKLAAS